MLEDQSNRRHWEAKSLGQEWKKTHGDCSYLFSFNKTKDEKEGESLMTQKIWLFNWPILFMLSKQVQC